jgi:hypothetical protein
MNSIILRGGLLLIKHQPLKYEPINIKLVSSPAWISGVLLLNNVPIYNLFPDRDNFIEIITFNNKYIKNKHTLFANDALIYESEHRYDFLIDVKLNSHLKDIPFNDFFKYY